VALDLAKLGVTRVRPLAGGFPEWQARGYPVATIAAESATRRSA
jgi:3-mercaptopyruvate sulfurtransferase SseA